MFDQIATDLEFFRVIANVAKRDDRRYITRSKEGNKVFMTRNKKTGCVEIVVESDTGDITLTVCNFCLIREEIHTTRCADIEDEFLERRWS